MVEDIIETLKYHKAVEHHDGETLVWGNGSKESTGYKGITFKPKDRWIVASNNIEKKFFYGDCSNIDTFFEICKVCGFRELIHINVEYEDYERC